MALHFDLKINGETIGTLEARRLWPSYGKPEGVNEYSVHVREIEPGQVIGWSGLVEHRYDDGAWELVRKTLEERSKGRG